MDHLLSMRSFDPSVEAFVTLSLPTLDLDVAVFVRDLADSHGESLLSETEAHVTLAAVVSYRFDRGRRLDHFARILFFQTEARALARDQS